MKTTPTTPSRDGSARAFGKSIRGLIGLGALTLASGGLRAGVLQEVYAGARSTSPEALAADFDLKAAEQNVKTQRLRYLPRVTAQAKELWTYQDVTESGTTVFQQGNDNYGVTRVLVELDQPLYDPTISPRIDASRARLRQQQYRTQASTEWQTRLIIEGFLKSVRLQELIDSSDRVIARLEKELGDVTKSQEAKVATVTDVQNIKLSLAGVKRERNNFVQQLRYEMAAMGPSSELLKGTHLKLDDQAKLADIFPAVPADQARETSLGVLGAEVDEIGHEASAVSRRSLPTLSLYAQYGLDNAEGSIFGGRRDLNAFEIGVVVRWDIFNRGMNRSEAMEFNYRRRAKESRLAAMKAEQVSNDEYGRSLLDQADQGVAELADLVQQHKVLEEASARAYEAGKESYLNAITAYLAYEATMRELITARHDQLMRYVAFNAESAGWDEGLVGKVDGLFAAK